MNGINLPRIDITILLYHSKRFIEGLTKGIKCQSYPHELMHLWFVDNDTDDGDLEVLPEIFRDWKGGLTTLPMQENKGFCGGNNEALRRQDAPFAFLLNADTCMEPDYLYRLVRTALANPDAGIIEGHQKPNEIKKPVDNETLETSWCALSAALIKKEALNKTGFLDDLYFAYCEDIDLSWRMWLNGYRCFHQKGAEYWHYMNDPQRNNNVQLFYCTRNLFFIRWIYGGKFKAYMYLLYCVIRSFVRREPIKEGHIMREAVFDVLKHIHNLPEQQKVNASLKKWITFKQRSLFPCRTLLYG